MRPLIGITSGFETRGSDEAPSGRLYLGSDYNDAVLQAGGLALPLPVPPAADPALVAEIVGRVDGLLFTGGPDLDPAAYGAPRHARTETMHARRQQFELELFRQADAAHKPILAICLGFQLAHVARGGQLVQHVDDLGLQPVTRHHRADEKSAYHPARVAPDSQLARAVNLNGRTEIEVNSRHHQGVLADQAGRGLRPVAWAPDGLLEASEDAAGRFLVAVQWHPENLTARAEHLGLFQALIAAARRSHA